MTTPAPPSVAVMIATFNRPEHLRICLDHIDGQTVRPDAVLVVDASTDEATRKLIAERTNVLYLRNAKGAGHTATSRRMALDRLHHDVIAFIDDDAYAEPDWLEQLLARYEDPGVGAVGGRALNGQPGEEAVGRDAVGQFLPDGTLTGNFAADTGRDVEVDHLLGANMSIRRSAALAVGGIEDHYPGTCLREETELPLKMRLAGWKVIFTPTAVVEHVAGPYAKGRRFDVRYTYYGQRNHIVLLARTVGLGDVRTRRYLRTAGSEARSRLGYARKALSRSDLVGEASKASGLANGLAHAFGVAAGVSAGLAVALVQPRIRARGTASRSS